MTPSSDETVREHDRLTALHSPRRCEHSAAILGLRRYLEARGYRILAVGPLGVTYEAGPNLLLAFTDDRAPIFVGGTVSGDANPLTRRLSDREIREVEAVMMDRPFAEKRMPERVALARGRGRERVQSTDY